MELFVLDFENTDTYVKFLCNTFSYKLEIELKTKKNC